MNKLQDFFKWLNDNQWLNMVFLILAILSILLSIYLFFKSKKSKIPIYTSTGTNLIRDNIQQIDGLDVFYKTRKVENLTITNIIVWNAGNDTISSSDIAKNSPLKIISNDDSIEIFYFEILEVSASHNDVTAKQIGNSIIFDFDFFNKKEGFAVKIIHSGKKITDISVTGIFKDFGTIKYTGVSFDNMFKVYGNLFKTKSTISLDFRKPFISLTIILWIASIFVFWKNPVFNEDVIILYFFTAMYTLATLSFSFFYFVPSKFRQYL